jgi:hypothetical protein
MRRLFSRDAGLDAAAFKERYPAEPCQDFSLHPNGEELSARAGIQARNSGRVPILTSPRKPRPGLGHGWAHCYDRVLARAT